MFEFRLALTVTDYDKMLAFYRDGLGLRVLKEWDNPPGRGLLLGIERATLELIDEPQAELIDDIEVGTRVSGTFRLAIEVDHIELTVERLLQYGATVVQQPILTPWGDYNQRILTPDGQQMTIYQSKK